MRVAQKFYFHRYRWWLSGPACKNAIMFSKRGMNGHDWAKKFKILFERCQSSWEEHGTSEQYKNLVHGRIRPPRRYGLQVTSRPSLPGALTLPDTWFRPPLWDLLVLQLLRPDSSKLPCLYSTFDLEYPLVLSRFCVPLGQFSKFMNREVKSQRNTC